MNFHVNKILVLAAGLVFSAASGISNASAAPFSYEDLVRLIRIRDLRSIDSVLPKLPEDLRSGYTFMLQSRSLQPATEEAPRVILYGRDASLVIAYSGVRDPSLSPQRPEVVRQFEIIQYRPRERAFDFRTITFSENGDRPVFSDRNPEICLSCHRQDPRPNWESYNIWPGALAGRDDLYLEENQPLIDALVERSRTDPRYGSLPNLREGYLPGGLPSPRDEPRTSFMHNIQLAGKLARWNFERILRLINRTPDYRAYRYAILASQFCPNIETFLPPEVRALHSLTPPVDPNASRSTLQLFFLFDQRGVDTVDWFMNLERRNRHFDTPGFREAELDYTILQDFPELRQYFRIEEDPYEFSHGHAVPRARTAEFCENFRNLSLRAFSQ